jgi:hypothetical protein
MGLFPAAPLRFGIPANRRRAEAALCRVSRRRKPESIKNWMPDQSLPVPDTGSGITSDPLQLAAWQFIVILIGAKNPNG